MTTPIAGPTTKTVNNSVIGTGSVYRKTVGYAQTKPFDRDLPYSLNRVLITSARNLGEGQLGYDAQASAVKSMWRAAGPDFPHLTQDVIDGIRNRAIAKFQAKLGTEMQLAMNWIERKESAHLFEECIVKLANFTKNVRRGNFHGAVRSLGITPSQLKKAGIKGLSKRMGDNWLKFHFGIEPIVADIYDFAKFMGEDFPTPTIHCSSGNTKDLGYFNVINRVYNEKTWSYGEQFASCGISAQILCINPNWHLADRVGLTNPVALLYDATPWSFVVDWFSNLGQYLSQWHDQYNGIVFGRVSHCIFVQVAQGSGYVYDYTIYDGRHWRVQQVNSLGFKCDRTVGLPGVTFKLKPVYRMSLERGVTAIALLLQGIK